MIGRRRVIAAASLLAAALAWGLGGRSTEPAPRTYEAELARSSETIASLRAGAASFPGSWTALERLAAAHLVRARLTGGYDDYEAADSLLARAFDLTPAGAGPFLGRAQLDFTLHRLDRVEQSLAAESRRLLLDDAARAAIEGLQADVALQRGRGEEARSGFERALALHDDMTGHARLAQTWWKSGRPDLAEREYRAALARYHGQSARPRAWVHLQLGLMDLETGRLERALGHYRDADRELRGWWLVEEHVAEVLALTGRTGEAVRRYEDLVRRTGHPEFMDQLARLHRDRGDHRAARRWAQRARAEHEARMARFPEASWGHALGHFLEFGDPARAVDLAERNWRLRPNEEARSALAAAYRRAGRSDEAARLARALRAAPPGAEPPARLARPGS